MKSLSLHINEALRKSGLTGQDFLDKVKSGDRVAVVKHGFVYALPMQGPARATRLEGEYIVDETPRQYSSQQVTRIQLIDSNDAKWMLLQDFDQASDLELKK